MTAKELLQELSDRILDVEDVVGMPGTPCPVQSQDTIHAARRLLRAHAEEVGIAVPGDARPEPPAKNDVERPMDHDEGKLTPADLAEAVSPGIRSLKPARHPRSDDSPAGC